MTFVANNCMEPTTTEIVLSRRLIVFCSCNISSCSPNQHPYVDSFFFFFFSSRRRHTRFDCDWSSDVCSSDLVSGRDARPDTGAARRPQPGHLGGGGAELAMARRTGGHGGMGRRDMAHPGQPRSEERRVGKEGRSRWSPYH